MNNSGNRIRRRDGRVGEEDGLKGAWPMTVTPSPLLGTGLADFPHPARMTTLTRQAAHSFPFLFGLLSQLLSQSSESRRQDRFPKGKFPCRWFRSRTFIVQSVLCSSDSACCHCGPLAPRSLPASQLLWAAPTPAPAHPPIICSRRTLTCPATPSACAGLSCS